MDDITITHLCARAADKAVNGPDHNGSLWLSGGEWRAYDPLHNRAQALALVERLHISLEYDPTTKLWIATPVEPNDITFETDLLRAICLCAARVQQARENQK